MKTKTNLKPATVSRQLRTAGFNPVSPESHDREGLKVKGSGDRVRVVADLDSDVAAERMIEDARTALLGLGYAVTDAQEGAVYVEKVGA